MAPPWIRASKRLHTHSPTFHPEKLSAGIQPVALQQALTIKRPELYAAIARTSLHSSAPFTVAVAFSASAALVIDALVDEQAPDFEFTDDLQLLADFERIALAARLGAGVCDLYMTALGFVWRDQARLIHRVAGPLADFVYEGPPTGGQGVVLAEAKGSTQSMQSTAIQRIADDAYTNQVAPHIGAVTPAGPVLHGYATAVCAATLRAGELCTAESCATTPPPTGTAAGGLRTANVSISTALGNYATSLRLAGLPEAADALHAVKTRSADPSTAAEAIERMVRSASRVETRYVVGSGFDPVARLAATAGLRFAVDIKPLLALARQLAPLRRGDIVEARIDLPIMPSNIGTDEVVSTGARFPDGFAALLIDQEASTEALAATVPRKPEPARQAVKIDTLTQEASMEALRVTAPLKPDPARQDVDIDTVREVIGRLAAD